MKVHVPIALLIALLGICLYGIGLLVSGVYAPALPASVGSTLDIPVRIAIPVIAVDAPIAFDVVWDTDTVVPGAPGGALLQARTGSDVFARLPELQEGDELFIESNDREVVRFVVTNSPDGAWVELVTDGVRVFAKRTP